MNGWMGEIALSGNKNLKGVCGRTGMIGFWRPSEYVAITERKKVKLKAGAELWVCFPFGRCHLAQCPQVEYGDHSRVEVAVGRTEVGSRSNMVALRFQWLRVVDVERIHTVTGAFRVWVSLTSTVASQRSATGCPAESKLILKQSLQDEWSKPGPGGGCGWDQQIVAPAEPGRGTLTVQRIYSSGITRNRWPGKWPGRRPRLDPVAARSVFLQPEAVPPTGTRSTDSLQAWAITQKRRK